MGFGDAYLSKAGIRDALIDTPPHPGLKFIVTIPVFNESGLERCLDSLFKCHAPFAGAGVRRTTHGAVQAEVLILVNAPRDAPAEILEQNQVTFQHTQDWIRDHTHPSINFLAVMDHSFTGKEAGVGLARKILMDEAVRRSSLVGNPTGIIASLDADATVEPNYLEALAHHFNLTKEALPEGSSGSPEGCSIYFEHPLEHDPIVQYELHLRYYLQSIRSTGYPHAFHTVGSCFAVRADIYCKEGGMNRRKGGEDFYFIQKVAQRGRFSECNTTCIRPSPRPSDRVPFGTGPVVARLMKGDGPLLTFHPEPFRILTTLFGDLESLYGPASGNSSKTENTRPGSKNPFLNYLHPVLDEFMVSQDFDRSLAEILKNSASYPSFRNRFFRWFNMFRILKFLHFAREQGFPDVPVSGAAEESLRQLAPGEITQSMNAKDLLLIYRRLDRQGIGFV